VADIKRKYSALSGRKTLLEVLEKISPVGQPFANLLDWAQSLDSIRLKPTPIHCEGKACRLKASRPAGSERANLTRSFPTRQVILVQLHKLHR